MVTIHFVGPHGERWRLEASDPDFTIAQVAAMGRIAYVEDHRDDGWIVVAWA